MTAQIPDGLDNRHAGVDLGELALYRIVTGDISNDSGWGEPYKFQNQPSIPDRSTTCSALWRGFVAEFSLDNDGTITLNAYSYPFAPNRPRVEVNERLRGDFWLVMNSQFEGKRVYLPVRNGLIVADETRWIVEGDESLESLKHPESPRRFEPKNIPLQQFVFVGVVTDIQFDSLLEDEPWIVLDRDIPDQYQWCAVQVRRNEQIIVQADIEGSSGGPEGPWLLDLHSKSLVKTGDHVWVTERCPTDNEIEAQMAAQANITDENLTSG